LQAIGRSSRASQGAVRTLRRAATAGMASVVIILGVVPLSAATGLTEAPFAPRSGPRGPTMFAELPAQQTGVITENKYADPAMWGARYQEFALGSMGTGVAVGDYDNDGRPDIFVVSKTEPCRLFRNLGNWKFEDVTEAAGLGTPRSLSSAEEPWKQGAAFADVNNDGWLDLYVCRFNAPNLLYINQHDGTFKEEAAARGLAVVDASGMGAFCDYDRDGWLDVFVQTNMLDAAAHPDGRPDYLFHNNGDGTFTDVTAKAGISGDTLAHSATWWDFDNDGWPDLYVAKDFGALDSLYRNNHDGTFTDVINRYVPHTAFSAMGVDLGDVNNDGLTDLFVSDMAATTHEKDHRGIAASRSLSTEGGEGSAVTPQYPRNALLLNTGMGPLREAAFLAGLTATDWTWSVRWEDLDNDGRLDLHVTNGMNREYQNVDLRDRIILAETPAERMQIMRSSPELQETHLAYRNLGDLQFQEVGKPWGLDQKGISFGAAFGDFDGDGDLDLVFANYQKGVTLLRNDSDTGHSIIVALKGHASNRFGVGSVVKIETTAGVQVRTLVLARGYLSTSEPILHFGLGEIDRINRMTVSWPSGRVQVFENLGVDRRFTIDEPETPVANRSEPASDTKPAFSDVSERFNLAQISRESIAQATNQQPLLPARLDRRGPALAVADVDGDGHDDVVIGGTQAEPPRVLLRQSDGRFAPLDEPALAPGPIADGPIALFDVDGNGTNDLLVTRGGANLRSGTPKFQPVLYLNDGHGVFQPAAADALPSVAYCAGAVAVADFDRDGRLDVFIGSRALVGQYPLPPRSALLANRGGRFEDVTESVAPALREVGMVTSALWSDVDGDGWLDLLIALDWGTIRYWHNRAGSGFEDWSERAGFASAGVGWWTSLAAGDFNGDGRMDYVAGNVGLNTQYQATPDAPALLYYGKFGAGSAQQLVEAFTENGQIYPWRTKKDLAARIPSIGKNFPKNDTYSRATLGEILGEDRLAAATRLAATEFRSGVFLSQPDGTYKFQPLPRIAQIAPLQGIVVCDVDGDGHADIYAIQNSFAPIPVVGRFDGGISQLLKGDGRGGFEAVEPRNSHLVVQGDAKALVTLDLDEDGWPDFLLSRNNSATTAYRNNGSPGHGGFRVRLSGPPGNLSAIGARVQLELKDGSQQTAEIQAGSGLYSQSSATVFFGFSDANPPRRVHVRWPSGAESASDVPAGSTSLKIESPKTP